VNGKGGEEIEKMRPMGEKRMGELGDRAEERIERRKKRGGRRTRRKQGKVEGEGKEKI